MYTQDGDASFQMIQKQPELFEQVRPFLVVTDLQRMIPIGQRNSNLEFEMVMLVNVSSPDASLAKLLDCTAHIVCSTMTAFAPK